MFKKLLIANRGEIAVRIIRACREMGIRTVAVYSEADRDALHTQLADEAVCIGKAQSSDSFLNMERILSATIATKAEAIHPGFGFLSENSRFVEMCEKCNVAFIGPSAEVISRMGNKSEAKNTMRKAKVPVVPGTKEPVYTVEQALEAVKEIGFPNKAVEEIAPQMVSFTTDDQELLPERKAWTNKGSYGKVLLIAGSKNMAGAALLSGTAAYKSGSGLVRIFSCEENRVILQEKLPEAILTTYDSEEKAWELLPESLSWASVIGIGPGIGQSAFASKLVKQVLTLGKAPLVIDADGLNNLAALLQEDTELRQLFHEYEGGMILTPHLKEMSRLTGEEIAEIRSNLPKAAASTADKGHVIVLKDARTIVSDGSVPSYINMSGNNGMATGGSGDVLTGIICGFLAGGLDILTAARLGVYCHGLAGDAAAKEKGYYSVLAGDLPNYLETILKRKHFPEEI